LEVQKEDYEKIRDMLRIQVKKTVKALKLQFKITYERNNSTSFLTSSSVCLSSDVSSIDA
jgi:hypothetical protein